MLRYLCLTVCFCGIGVAGAECPEICPLEPDINLDSASPGSWLNTHGKSITNADRAECPITDASCLEFSYYVNSNHGVADGINLPYMGFFNFEHKDPFSSDSSSCCKYFIRYELSSVPFDDS